MSGDAEFYDDGGSSDGGGDIGSPSGGGPPPEAAPAETPTPPEQQYDQAASQAAPPEAQTLEQVTVPPEEFPSTTTSLQQEEIAPLQATLPTINELDRQADNELAARGEGYPAEERKSEGQVGAGGALDALLKILDKYLPGAKKVGEAVANGTVNWPATLQLLASIMSQLSPLGPGLAQFLHLHGKTATKHIPAALATLQLVLGKLSTKPTAHDKGVIFDVSSLKDALGQRGVRFSEDEDIPDQFISEPLGNVIDRVIAGLPAGLRAELQSLADQIVGTLTGQLDSFVADAARTRDIFDGAITELGGTGGTPGERATGAVAGFFARLSDAITRGLLPEAERIIEPLRPILAQLITLFANVIGEAVSVAHAPISDAIAPLFTAQLEVYRRSLLGTGEVRPGEQVAIAEQAFSHAVEFGIFAHFLAAAAELAHPTKHIGLKQLAAGVADAAAFAPITRNTIGVELEAAIGRPARWEANARTRSSLPGLGPWTDAYTRRFIEWDALAQRLRYEGWPEEQINAYKDVPFRRPSVRELAAVYEDVSVEPEAIVTILKRGGYHDDDIDVVLTGLRSRSLKSFRSGYLSESVSAYADGTLTSDGLDVALDALSVRDEGRRLVHQRADLARARHIHSMLLTQYRGLVKGGLFTLDDFRLALSGLGVDEPVAAAEVGALDAFLREQVAKQETADVKAGVRAMQRLTAETYEREVRLGIASPGEMEGALAQSGVATDQAAAMATLAGIKALPVPRLPVELSAEAAAQRIQDLNSEVITTLVRKRLMEGPFALLSLVALGLEPQDATARIAVAVAQSQEAAKLPTPPKESADVRQVRQIRTQEALAAFRSWTSSEAELRAALTTAGNSQAVVDALVSREVAAAAVRAERELDRQAAAAAAQASKAAQAGA